MFSFLLVFHVRLRDEMRALVNFSFDLNTANSIRPSMWKSTDITQAIYERRYFFAVVVGEPAIIIYDAMRLKSSV